MYRTQWSTHGQNQQTLTGNSQEIPVILQVVHKIWDSMPMNEGTGLSIQYLEDTTHRIKKILFHALGGRSSLQFLQSVL